MFWQRECERGEGSLDVAFPSDACCPVNGCRGCNSSPESVKCLRNKVRVRRDRDKFTIQLYFVRGPVDQVAKKGGTRGGELRS